MDAKYMPAWARKCCEARHMTPRTFENVNLDRPIDACDPSVVVMIVRNSRREVRLTASDYHYSNQYLA